MQLTRYNKFLVALATAATVVAALAINTRVTEIAAGVVSVLGALGVYAAPNREVKP